MAIGGVVLELELEKAMGERVEGIALQVWCGNKAAHIGTDLLESHAVLIRDGWLSATATAQYDPGTATIKPPFDLV